MAPSSHGGTIPPYYISNRRSLRTVPPQREQTTGRRVRPTMQGYLREQFQSSQSPGCPGATILTVAQGRAVMTPQQGTCKAHPARMMRSTAGLGNP